MSTVITKPTWTVDGWTGNVVDDNGVDWFVHTDEGWWSPVAMRQFDEDRPVADGTYSAASLGASRVIVLTGYAQAPDPASADAAIDQFNALCRTGHLHQLVVAEPVTDKWAWVKRGGGQLTRTSPRAFDFQLILVAPDPRKYAVAGNSVATTLATPPIGGVEWNGPAPGTTGTQWSGPAGTTGLQYQADSGTPGIIALANSGAAPTPVTFTVDGPAVSPTIRNLTTGQVLTYGGTLLAGDHLVIDTGPQTVVLNGVNRKVEMTSRQWWEIPGGSSVTVSFEAESASAAVLTAAWWDASY